MDQLFDFAVHKYMKSSPHVKLTNPKIPFTLWRLRRSDRLAWRLQFMGVGSVFVVEIAAVIPMVLEI